MKRSTKNKLIEYAQSLPASTQRASAYNIANLSVKTTIAAALLADHRSADGALRAADLMVRAGCAKEIKDQNKPDHFYGTFTFDDGSKLC